MLNSTIAPIKKLWSIAEYQHLTSTVETIAPEKWELIAGEVLVLSPKGFAHVVCCRRVLQQLSRLVADRLTLQCQDPIQILPNSQPEPDFVLLPANYSGGIPLASDVLLVIEISDSTLGFDRTTKQELYAQSNIPEYWIINLVDRQLHQYTEPTDQGYFQHQILLPESTIPIPGLPGIEMILNSIFPAPLS
jgi:Uma2 family endonuclease